MSSSHHGSEFSPEDRRRQQEIMDRFIKQVEGKANRQYSAGRIGPDDEGDLAMAITADTKNKVVILRFGKPVEWIGIGEAETKSLIQSLIAKLRKIATQPFTIEV